MITLYIKTARYSIIAAALAVFFTAVPTFAAEKNTKSDRHFMSATRAREASSTTTDTSNDAEVSSSTASTTASSTAVSSNTATDTSDTSVGSNTVSPAKTEVVKRNTPPPAENPKAEPATPAANAFTAAGNAVTSVKDKIFAKPVATTATTSTTTSAIATTGIATLFAGPALSGNVYDSNRFGESDTYKMLALALALAAAGLFLTNAEVFSRTYGGIIGAITLRPSPETSRSRA